MGLSSSKDEAIRGEIGCDSIGTVPCSESSSLMCFEGICALFVAETEKRCVERCNQSRRKRRRLNQECEREQNIPTDIESSPHLNNASTQRSQSERLADRPRSGYYEHELCGDMDNAVNIDRMETADSLDSTREATRLLACHQTDHETTEISKKPPTSHRETSASPG
ncbi:hypothetical protein TSMEX_001494 [Taenia solium]|eukprot:TsM_000551200 transcript=TsM_000551200 gene=TsM_000551200